MCDTNSAAFKQRMVEQRGATISRDGWGDVGWSKVLLLALNNGLRSQRTAACSAAHTGEAEVAGGTASAADTGVTGEGGPPFGCTTTARTIEDPANVCFNCINPSSMTLGLQLSPAQAILALLQCSTPTSVVNQTPLALRLPWTCRVVLSSSSSSFTISSPSSSS